MGMREVPSPSLGQGSCQGSSKHRHDKEQWGGGRGDKPLLVLTNLYLDDITFMT
jgi:hypothetical protein